LTGGKRMYRSGMISISIALLIFLFASLSALVISGVMKEVIEVETRVQSSLNSSKARLTMISNANIWRKFLTDNGGYWDEIQYEFQTTQGTVTSLVLTSTGDDYIKININNSEKTINYSIVSTTTQYSKFDRYIRVNMDVFINGKKTVFGGLFDLGWPGF